MRTTLVVKNSSSSTSHSPLPPPPPPTPSLPPSPPPPSSTTPHTSSNLPPPTFADSNPPPPLHPMRTCHLLPLLQDPHLQDLPLKHSRRLKCSGPRTLKCPPWRCFGRSRAPLPPPNLLPPLTSGPGSSEEILQHLLPLTPLLLDTRLRSLKCPFLSVLVKPNRA